MFADLSNDLTSEEQAQVALEEEYAEQSIIKGMHFQDEALRQGQAMRLQPIQAIVQAAYESSKAALDEELSKRNAGAAAKYRRYVRAVGSDICISIALRTMINMCFIPEVCSMQRVLVEIGKAVEAELYIREVSAVNPLQVQHAEEYLDRGKISSVHLRANAFHAALKYIGVNDRPRWDSAALVQVGKLCAQAVYSSTGLFFWQKHPKTQQFMLYPSEELTEHCEQILETVQPIVHYPPMLVPPKDWDGLYQGGYYTAWFRHHAPACSFRRMPKDMRVPLQDQFSQEQTAGIRKVMNLAQSVPYRINHRVLSALQQALQQGDGCMGLSKTNPEPMPEFPFPDDWDSKTRTPQEDAKFRVWKHSMREWHISEHLRVSRSYTVLNALRTMLRFKDKRQIYFPVFLDWRGRLYYRGVLNPQAQDSVKAVLEFSEGKELGKAGLFWLQVHIANCCGYDKTSFEDRSKWTQENTQDLRNWFENFLEKPAPDPSLSFQLYAALNAYFEALGSGNPEQYRCHVPVAMDATCSGLQHFSAMLRDEIGAKYVNCFTTSTEKKADIYAEVANRAMQVLPEYADEVQQIYWEQHGIPRSMAKKPVMTFVYGSTLSSSIDYVTEDMLERSFEPIRNADGEMLVHQGQLAVAVAKALRAAVQTTVPKAAAMMDYLRVAVHQQREPLAWVTPMGLKVLNWVDKQIDERICIRSMGVKQIVMRRSTDDLDVQKATNSIAPNFVHSMDACHLQMTVLAFNDSMQLVHDSFACHAADVDRMQQCIRREFHNLYSFNIADLIAKHNPIAAEALAEQGISRPEDGSYNLQSVLDSYFFFC